MEDIIGRMVYLTDAEQKATQYESPIDVAEIDGHALLESINRRREEILNIRKDKLSPFGSNVDDDRINRYDLRSLQDEEATIRNLIEGVAPLQAEIGAIEAGLHDS